MKVERLSIAFHYFLFINRSIFPKCIGYSGSQRPKPALHMGIFISVAKFLLVSGVAHSHEAGTLLHRQARTFLAVLKCLFISLEDGLFSRFQIKEIEQTFVKYNRSNRTWTKL